MTLTHNGIEYKDVLRMGEDSFFSRAQKHLPIKIIKQVWEHGSLFVYFVYLNEEGE